MNALAANVARRHLVQDLLAEAPTAPEPHRTLMRRAAEELQQFEDFVPIGIGSEIGPIPIHPPSEGEDAQA